MVVYPESPVCCDVCCFYYDVFVLTLVQIKFYVRIILNGGGGIIISPPGGL